MEENTSESRRPPRKPRSLFWPIVLIGAGAMWLLANMGIFEETNFTVLLRLWPLILVVIGVDIIFERSSPILGTLLGLGTVALLIFLMLVGPSMGWASEGDLTIFGLPVDFSGEEVEVKTASVSEEIGGATSADILLDLGRWKTNVETLSGSDNLIEADITYYGDLRFEVRGDEHKRVDLGYDFIQVGVYFPSRIDDSDTWEIGLSPDVPMNLTVDSGSGSVVLDLRGLQLTELTIDSGSGSVELLLPATDEPYEVHIDSGSGSVKIDVPEGANVEFDVESGSGSVTFDVPDGAGVQVDVQDSASGSLNFPQGYQKVRDRDDEDEGVWESPNFGDADYKIIIVIDDRGSGSINVR